MSLFDSSSSSQVGLHIEQATSHGSSIDDITLHLEICDMINETRDGHKQAAKVLKKKLNPKLDDATLMKALTLLETCVKNCSKRFHLQVTTKDFVNTLVKLLEKTRTTLVREKVLGIIQAWADAFRSDPNMRYLCNTYQDLVLKGIEFPAQNLDEMAPIHTPAATVSHPAYSDDTPDEGDEDAIPVDYSNGHGVGDDAQADVDEPPHTPYDDGTSGPAFPAFDDGADANPVSQVMSDEEYARQLSQQFAQEEHRQPQQQQQPMQQHIVSVPEGQRVMASEQQQEKLRQDLLIVRNNCEMLHEMLSALDPDATLEGQDVIQDLHNACTRMQSRLIDLISQLQNEDLLSECLDANDKVSSAIEHYNDIKERQQRKQQQQPQGEQQGGQQPTLAQPTQVSVAATTADPFAPHHQYQPAETQQQQQQLQHVHSPVSSVGYGDPFTLQPSPAPESQTQHDYAYGDPFASRQSVDLGVTSPTEHVQTRDPSTDGPNATSGTFATKFDDPFGVPEPLEVQDAQEMPSAHQQQLAPTTTTMTLQGATTSSSHVDADEHTHADVDEFDPFKQHEGTMAERRMQATSYEVPEPESNMRTFSTALHGQRSQQQQQPQQHAMPQFDDMDEPDTMDFSSLSLGRHQQATDEDDEFDSLRRSREIAPAVDSRRKLELEEKDNDLFGL
ncbi:hypothetical protein PTSG_10737 [Salpingoeca rosetta]|uniref:VHS domain-containing protein n=1 Tax=Salpingoeca rosetta (strain ATCC 50818 / BSB-021) TaxID=946362 RepID=F2UQ85_SALR5|nr:uncharacterized protein PTSG_10737 [Salpingoeca rosetta]EGD79753.1 hypothetical protein PTSG_10737 [Salpingoeca rosetta]|eukprot:XP_004988702.1 hypothetical protein PTSG_10737 [Salpingoeca rosetta]